MTEIKNFAELLEPELKKQDKSLKIVSYTTANLVSVGDNYGSVILAVEVDLNNGEKKHLVAKLNPSEEILKKIFNISIAFKKEAEFYSIIVPILHNFQKENSVEILDLFAKSFGQRYSLSSDPDAFDDDACFLLENVKLDGYIATKRSDLFDFQTIEYLLKSLAHFHALPIAMKIKQPEDFKRIKSCLKLNYTDEEFIVWYSAKVYKLVNQLILNDTEMAPYAERVNKLYHHASNEYLKMNVLGSEPFNTITHNDMWLTNIMLKFDDNKKPIAHRLVDYQMAAYGNPANDVLFLIFSSVQSEVIAEHIESLIDIYFNEFISKLQAYKVNTKSFTKTGFVKEIDSAAKCMQFYHIIFMMEAVFLEVQKDDKIENILKDDLVTGDGFVKQLKVFLMYWVKHNWL